MERVGILGDVRLDAAITLNGVPWRREGTGILDVKIHLERLTVVDQMEALDDVKLRGMRRLEAVDGGPGIEPDGVDDKRVGFVMADRFAVPGRLHVRRML